MKSFLISIAILCCAANGLFAAQSASDPQSAHHKHWAFIPPQRPATLPILNTYCEIRNSHYALRNPIDAFILARLEQEKIKPSPEADRDIVPPRERETRNPSRARHGR